MLPNLSTNVLCCMTTMALRATKFECKYFSAPATFVVAASKLPQTAQPFTSSCSPHSKRRCGKEESQSKHSAVLLLHHCVKLTTTLGLLCWSTSCSTVCIRADLLQIACLQNYRLLQVAEHTRLMEGHGSMQAQLANAV